MEIIYDFLDLNKYINAERTNRFMAAKLKKDMTALFEREFINHEPINGRFAMSFNWYMKNKRKDPDNIAFQKKFILDGMIKAGVIQNDNINTVIGFCDNFIVKGHEGVKIEFIHE